MAGEEQELETLKKWWSENGKSLLAGLGIGLVAVAGWTSWQTWQRTQAELRIGALRADRQRLDGRKA